MPEGIEPVSRVIYRDVTPELSQHMLTDMDKLPAVQLGDFLLQIELDEPSDTVREIAHRELRETPDVAAAAIAELRRLLEADKDLHVPLESDAWLVRFLRPCKYYPESAYQLIRRYFAFKVKHSKHYNGLMPSREQNIFNQDILTVLPTRDQLGRRILVIELGKRWKPSKCTLDEAFKGCVLFLEAAMMEPATQICGAEVIMDMEGLSLQQVWQFTPQYAKRLLDWLQESIPVRIKGLYVVNQPYIFNMVFQLFKPFLKEKLRSRLLFIGKDWELLHKHVSPKCLPEAYGGTLSIPKITGPQWLELLMMCDKEFSAIASYGYVNKELIK